MGEGSLTARSVIPEVKWTTGVKSVSGDGSQVGNPSQSASYSSKASAGVGARARLLAQQGPFFNER